MCVYIYVHHKRMHRFIHIYESNQACSLIYTYIHTYIYIYICIHTAAAAAKSLQLCPTLCNPIDSSLPGSSVPGILQARNWSGLPFPSPMHENEVAQSCPTRTNPMDSSLQGSSVHGIFLGKSTGVACHCLL